MGLCDICSSSSKAKPINEYDKKNMKINIEEENLINNGKEKLEKNESKIDELDKNTKISISSIESEKNINTDFLYWNNGSKSNFNNDFKVYLDFKMIKNLKGILKLLFLKFLSKITLNEQLLETNNKNMIKMIQDLNKV